MFDQAIAEADEEFINWVADARNADVIARANGDKSSVHDGGGLLENTKEVAGTEMNPF